MVTRKTTDEEIEALGHGDVEQADIAALQARIAELESKLPKPKPVLKPEDLKHLPNQQIGASERLIQRAKLMARPICPIDDRPEILQRDGSYSENPAYTGEPNCQTLFGGRVGWWIRCQEKGHEPYFTVTRRVKRSPVTDAEGVITGYREELIEARKLNTTRVAISLRVNSGRGEQYARVLKGRKDLEDLGYWPKCEFRNCEIDWNGKETKYGRFCGERHARLVGADVEVEMLDPRKKRNTEKKLREIDLTPEGSGYRIQEVPDLDNPDMVQRVESLQRAQDAQQTTGSGATEQVGD